MICSKEKSLLKYTHLQATKTCPRAKACKKVCLSNYTDTATNPTDKQRKTEGQFVTHVWRHAG